MKNRFANQPNLTRRLQQLLVLFALMFLPLGSWAQIVFDGGGDGTQNSPYIIQSSTDLLRLSTWINDGTLQGDEYFEVDANAYQIDCSTLGTTFQPVGTANRPFRGFFKGNNIVISNLTVNASSDEDCNGFFGYIDGGTVSTLRLSRCTFTGGSDCGAVAGRLVDGTIENCTVASCSLTSGNAQNVNAGGVVGQANKGTITGCQVDGTPIIGSSTFATASGSSRVGGIVGYANSTDDIYVTSCQVTSVAGETTILSKHSAPTEIIAGGIVGSCSDGYSNFNGNTVTAKNEVTVNCQNPANSTNVVVKCGAIVGVVGGAAFINNTYEYGVTTSITDAQGATTTRLAYQSRGTGSEDASNSSYDIFPDNGALMYTKWVYLPPETEQGSASAGDADLQYQHSNSSSSEMYVAPGQTAYFSVTPFAGYYPSSVKAQYEGTTIDATFVRYDSGIYYYTFEMPDANVTVDATFTQGTAYDLFVGGTQVTEANADDVLGDGTVSFYTSGGQEAAPTYTLVLDGATLTKPVQVGLPNLTIDLHGANTITTKTTCIQNIAANVVPSLTFDSNADQVGSLTLKNTDEDFTGVISDSYYGYFTISKKLALILERYGYTYSNEYYFTAGEVHDALLAPSYGVQIGNMLIYEGNAADVTGDGIGDGAEGGMVSFNEETSTLTLTNASLSGGICTSLPELTVELVGDNTLNGDGNYPVFRSITGDNVTITIQSTAEVTGSLTVNVPSTQAGKACEDEVTLDIKDPLSIISGSLTGNTNNNNKIMIGVVRNLGLTVSGVQVTNANASNITGDKIVAASQAAGYKVSYDEATHTLTLNNANLQGADNIGITTDNDLTIACVGTNYIFNPVKSTKAGGATLTFQFDGNDGDAALTLNYQGDGEKGFTSVVYDGMYLSAENSRDIRFNSGRQRFEESEWACASTIKLTNTKTYDLWLGATKVTEANKDNILGTDEPTAMFDPDLNTLTLNGLTLTGTSIYDDGVISRLPELTIVINGANTIYVSDSCTAIRGDVEGPQTLTIVKGSENSSLALNASRVIRNFNTLTLTGLYWNDRFTYKYDESLYNFAPGFRLMKAEGEEAGRNLDTGFVPTLSDVPYAFGLTVAGTAVTEVNMQDVLDDKTTSPRVIYNGKGTLILNNYSDAAATITSTSSLDALTVYLKGNNAVKSIVGNSANANHKLVLDTDPVTPGTLTLSNGTDPVISGFKEVELSNGLIWQEGDATAAEAKAGVGLPVIATQEEQVKVVTPDADELTNVAADDKVSENDDPADQTEVMNKVVDAVLYTLVVKTEDGTANTVIDNNAVVLNTVVSDADLDNAQKETPGTDESAKLFNGVTLKQAAGSGTLMLDIEVAEGNKLMVKIGNNDPVEFTNVADVVEVPYVCEDYTYVYIYNGTPAPSTVRGDRAKVLTTPVKVISVTVSPASVQQNVDPATEPVVDKTLASGEIQDKINGDGVFKLSDEDASQLTSLSNAVFEAQAAELNTIDLSKTSIKDVTVDRNDGPFKGVSPQTFIYLPAGNSAAAGEPNVVIGAVCNKMQLTDDDKSFAPVMNFGVKEATLSREYVADQTSTVYLPFAVSQAAADELGTFYTFKGVNATTGDADLQEVATGGLAANTAYIFQKKAGGKVTVKDVTVKKNDVVIESVLVGTYKTIEWDQATLDSYAGVGSYIYGFAATDQGDDIKAGEFVRVGAGATIKPYRAYLVLKESYGARIAINWGDEATGITNTTLTNRTNVADGIVYDLQGRRISQPTRGLYIQNGRKVLVK